MKSLANHFLIAMPALDDDNFGHSVTLICQHDKNGAMGVVINQALDLTLLELLSNAGFTTAELQQPTRPVWYGGPVNQEYLFVLHDDMNDHHPAWQQSTRINNNLHLTTSADFLQALSEGLAVENYLLALGCAAWAPGQLEYEMSENSWIYAAAENNIIFNTDSSKRWHAAASLANIDLNKMSYYSGEA